MKEKNKTTVCFLIADVQRNKNKSKLGQVFCPFSEQNEHK